MAIIKLFRNRNLALGCAIFLVALYLCYYVSTTFMIIAGSVCIISAFFLWIAYFITKRKAVLNLSIRLTPLLILIIAAIIVSSLTFLQDKKAFKYCDGDAHKIEGVVDSVISSSTYYASYTVAIKKIDNNDCNFKAVLADECGALTKNDTFSSSAVFYELENQRIGFATANYYLDNGILLGGEITEYTKIENGENDIFDLFLKINRYLDRILERKLSSRTYPIASALLLGNRDLLSDTVTRDFTRLGIVHILSLSGMHVSIIVTMIGYAISKTNLSKITQVILIITFVGLFIGVSGFSEPAIRAGVMQCLFLLIVFLWDFADTISSLFVSVTLICIFAPYLIFSVSLMLSFFAMLGCICFSKILYKSKIMYSIRSRLLRFIIFTSVTTLGVTFVSLPLTYIYFGTFSLASIPANIVLVPILNIIIYLVPFILIFSPIDFISDVLAYFCEVLCKAILSACEYFSSIRNISISIRGNIQLIGIIIIFVASLLLIILSKRLIKLMLGALAIGVIIFTVGTIFTSIERSNSIYFTSYSVNNNDTVCIEHNNKLTVVDISSHSLGIIYPRDMSSYLGYTEVENYVSMSYSNKLSSYLDKMTDTVVVRHIYLPSPKNENEEEYFNRCAQLLDIKNVKYTVFDNELYIDGLSFDICPEAFISRSTKRSVVFSIEYNSFYYTYMGASAFEILSSNTDKYAYNADAIVFGAYGPKYMKDYEYYLKNLDYAIFIGNSENYADKYFFEELYGKLSTDEPFTVRISK